MKDYCMRRYASSKFRIVVLIGILLTIALVVRPMYAAGPATPAGATAAPASSSAGAEGDLKPRNPFSLVLDNLDFVFLTIAMLSITGLSLIIHGFIRNRRDLYMPADSVNRIRAMIESGSVEELKAFTGADPTFISKVLHPAIRRYPNFQRMRETLETTVSDQTAESFRKIEYLNIIANLGPLLGLLGTVLGMINAFQTMSLHKGGTDFQSLTGGISQALTHTMLGLVLAIPCLAAFGVLRTLVDRLTTESAVLADELVLSMFSEEETSAGLAGPRTVAPPPAIRQPLAR
jgi:biopolymer transport protein ExbB